MNAMLRADFAIRLFVGERGHPPRELAELVPDYLNAIPEDPYSGKAICYRLAGSEWAVYSVGRDGADDGGVFGGRKAFSSSSGGYDYDLDTMTRP
jgi:hypothetical protein